MSALETIYWCMYCDMCVYCDMCFFTKLGFRNLALWHKSLMTTHFIWHINIPLDLVKVQPVGQKQPCSSFHATCKLVWCTKKKRTATQKSIKDGKVALLSAALPLYPSPFAVFLSAAEPSGRIPLKCTFQACLQIFGSWFFIGSNTNSHLQQSYLYFMFPLYALHCLCGEALSQLHSAHSKWVYTRIKRGQRSKQYLTAKDSHSYDNIMRVYL